MVFTYYYYMNLCARSATRPCCFGIVTCIALLLAGWYQININIFCILQFNLIQFLVSVYNIYIGHGALALALRHSMHCTGTERDRDDIGDNLNYLITLEQEDY